MTPPIHTTEQQRQIALEVRRLVKAAYDAGLRVIVHDAPVYRDDKRRWVVNEIRVWLDEDA